MKQKPVGLLSETLRPRKHTHTLLAVAFFLELHGCCFVCACLTCSTPFFYHHHHLYILVGCRFPLSLPSIHWKHSSRQARSHIITATKCAKPTPNPRGKRSLAANTHTQHTYNVQNARQCQAICLAGCQAAPICACACPSCPSSCGPLRFPPSASPHTPQATAAAPSEVSDRRKKKKGKGEREEMGVSTMQAQFKGQRKQDTRTHTHTHQPASPDRSWRCHACECP